MGDKMIKALLPIALLLFNSSVFSQNVEYNYYQTSDNDGVKVNKHTITTSYSLVNVGLNNTEYLTPTGKYNSQALILSPKIKLDKFETIGYAGIGRISNKNYLFGDITGTFNLTNNFKSHLTVFGDVVDATTALNENISFYGIVKTVEYSNDNAGIVIGPKFIKFSNDNYQRGYLAKVWISIFDGVNLYVSTKDYKNSLPFNGIYFSPDHYNRTGYGLSIKKKLSNIKIFGLIEKSNIKTINGKEPASTWKLEFEVPISNNLKGIITSGKDFGTTSQFKYQYNSIVLKYIF